MTYMGCRVAKCSGSHRRVSCMLYIVENRWFGNRHKSFVVDCGQVLVCRSLVVRVMVEGHVSRGVVVRGRKSGCL